MGFMDFISNIGSKIRSGISSIGNFVSEKVKPVIGVVTNVARKISDVVNSGPGQAIIGGLSNIPGIGGLIAKGAGVVGRVAGTVADIGEGLQKGIDVGQGIAQNISSDNPDYGRAISDVQQGVQIAKDTRDRFNQGRQEINQARQEPKVYPKRAWRDIINEQRSRVYVPALKRS
jgi:phage-related protein